MASKNNSGGWFPLIFLKCKILRINIPSGTASILAQTDGRITSQWGVRIGQMYRLFLWNITYQTFGYFQLYVSAKQLPVVFFLGFVQFLLKLGWAFTSCSIILQRIQQWKKHTLFYFLVIWSEQINSMLHIYIHIFTFLMR